MSDIAIVGAQCLFPGGANSPQALMRTLMSGNNFCQEVPANRWNVAKHTNDQRVAGKAQVRRGHFIDYDFKSFDATAFRFAPREVEFIDPQQRLLLETSWEALESGGFDHRALAGSDIGVYVGGFTTDHLLNQFSSRCRSAIGQHSAAGATLTMLANRVSYAFDFRGPSISVDTACSSSLVAFAYAVNDILSGRCTSALVGGVNFMLRPEYVIAMSKGSFLAPDGRSKSFSADADGYGRGEGCGVVILKRADLALADGDRILAFVDGAAVNQDGRTDGISVPNPEAQATLMSRVATENGIVPGSVQYVEAHGTGTPVGDPLEARAIGKVYGQIERTERCGIGSLKSNLGHLEAAAGIAGIIKAVGMLQENLVPPLALHGEINTNIPFDDYNLELVTKARTLAAPGTTRRVAVNSFGYGGTNAHAILSLPDDGRTGAAPESCGATPITVARMASDLGLLVPVSAESPTALELYAQALGEALDGTRRSARGAILSTNVHRRTHHTQRAAVWAHDAAEAIARLQAFDVDSPGEGVHQGRATSEQGAGAVFVYTGMGPQWWAMGRKLYQNHGTYRDALDDFDDRFSAIAGFSILEEMLKEESHSIIGRTELAQPANFALQYALTKTLEHEGVAPAAVVGHSVGEVAAAWASGMLSLDAAIRVSHQRSRIQAKAAGQGAMLAVGLDEGAVRERIESLGGAVDIAAVNAANSLTLSGDASTLRELHDSWSAEGIFVRQLAVEVPYHSAAMEPLRAELLECLKDIEPGTPDITLCSTVTGRIVTDERYDAAYWAANVRQPVLFKAAIEQLLDAGYQHFVEVGPHPVLSRAIQDTLKERGSDARLSATLNMKVDDIESLRQGIAALYCAGGTLDWAKRHPRATIAALPSYPWDRQRLWREPEGQRADREDLAERPFSEVRMAPNTTFTDLNSARLNFLIEHQVDGAPVMPAAGYLEALLEATSAAQHTARGWRLCDIVVHSALVQDRDRGLILETRRQNDGRYAEVLSYDEVSGADPQLHATAALSGLAAGHQGPAVFLDDLQARAPNAVDVTETYRGFSQIALDYGEAFQSIQRLYHSDDRRMALVELALPTGLHGQADDFIAHPVLVDGSFQAALSLIGIDDGAYLPTRIDELRVFARLPRRLWARIELTEHTLNRIACDITYITDTGEVLAALDTLSCTALRRRDARLELPPVDYAYQWVETHESGVPAPLPVTVLSERDDAFGAGFVAACRSANVLELALDWDDPERITKLRRAVRPDGGQAAVVMICACDSQADDDPIGLRSTSRILAAVKGFAQTAPFSPRLYLLTRNAIATTDGDPSIDPAQGALHTLARVVYNEVDATDLSVIDLDRNRPCFEAALHEIMSGNAASEVALRDTQRLTPMLRPSEAFARPPVRTLAPDCHASINFAGESLAEIPIPAPGPGQLIIAFDNLSLLPGETNNGERMGFVGRVQALGTGVTRWPVGTRLCGLLPKSLCATVVVDARGVEDCIVAVATHADVWSAPMLARLGLVDSPARRIGSMLEIAPDSRAVVCTTEAGSALAVLLENEGVDVVRLPTDPTQWTASREPLANAEYSIIAAPATAFREHFGLGALQPGGQFVDLDMRPTALAIHERIGTFLRLRSVCGRIDAADISASLSEGPIDLGPAQCRPLEHWHSVSRDTKDIVHLAARCATGLDVETHGQPEFRADRTYLVTGGLSGLGEQTAHWLASRGAGHIVLCGRRGPHTPGAMALVEALGEQGATVEARTLDVADAQAVAALLEELDGDGGQLAGVFHAAGVLEDKPCLELSADDMAKVMLPKALGALHLHRATRRMQLEYFVLYSSISAIVGNARQANYCAANGFLDGLAHRRHGMGLPATSVNFGAISGAGMAGDATVLAHLTNIGLPPLPIGRALAGVGLALTQGRTQLVIAADPDWGRWAKYEARGAQTTKMAEVLEPFLRNTDDGRIAAIKRHLETAPLDERLDVVASLVAEIVANALKLDASQLTGGTALAQVGVDSLMSLDIQLSIEEAFGTSISTMLLMGTTTIAGVAAKILTSLGLGSDVAPTPAAMGTVALPASGAQ